MNEHEKIREQMWDLIYGLTTAEEKAALHARIKSDRTVARMYAEVRLEADLIAEAAKVEDTSISLPQLGSQKERAAAGRAKAASKMPAASGAGIGWSLHWLAAIGASALAVLMAVGIFWWPEQPRREDTYLVSVDVRSETPLVRGLDQEMEVLAQNVAAGKPAKIDLKAQIVKKDGTPVYERWIATDDSGKARLHVPSDFIDRGNKLGLYAEAPLREQQVAQQGDGVSPLPSGSPNDQARELERRVAAKREKQSEPLVEATLDVIDDPLKARLSFDRDWYEPGQTVAFRAHVTSAFTQRPPDVQSLDLRLVGPDGSALAPEETQPHPETGVVTGKFRLPAEAQSGHYALTIQSSTRGEPQANAIVQVGREFAQTNKFWYQRDLREWAAADVKQQDGTMLKRGLATSRRPAAGTASREDGRSSTAEADQAGALASKEMPTKESGGRPGGGSADPMQLARTPQPPAPANAPVPTDKDDAGITPPTPALAEANFADSRTDVSSQMMDELRKVDDSRKLNESVPTTLSLVLPPQVAGKPLLVEARQSQVVIGKLEVPADANQVQEALGEEAEIERLGRRLSIPLPPQVTGPVDVIFFDNTVNPPRAVRAQRFDIPARTEFDVALADGESTYAPGQTVRFKLQVRDQGQAASNVSFGYKVAPLLAMTTADDAAADRFSGNNEFFQQKPEPADAPARAAKEGEEASQGRRRMVQLEDARLKGAQVAPAESQPTAAPGAAGALGPVALGGAGPVAARNGAAVELHESPHAALDLQFRFGKEVDQLILLPDTRLEAEQSATPTLLASNTDIVRRALDEQQASQAAQEVRIAMWRHWLGKGLLLGGVLLLVVLGVGVYLQRPSHARAWVPSLAIAAASFLVGMVWLIQRPRPEGPKIAQRPTTIADRELPQSMSGATGVATGLAGPETLSASFDAPAPAAGESAIQYGAGIEDASPGGTIAGGFGGGSGRDIPLPATPPIEPAADRSETLADRAMRKDAGGAIPDAAAKSGLEAAPRDGAEPAKKLAAGGSPKAEAVNDATEFKDRLDRDKASPPQPMPTSEPSPRTRATRGAVKNIAKGAAASSEKNAEKDEKSQAGLRAEGAMAESRSPTPTAPGGDGFRLFKTLGDGEAHAAGLIWVPLLMADENGEAVIEFTMPQQPGDYKLILDVLGPGRATQIEKLIRCEVPPAAAAPAAKDAKP